MSAMIIDLGEERGRRRPRELSSPPPTPSNLDWEFSQRGNPYFVVNEALHIVLFQRAGIWAFRIEDLETGQAWFSERRYQTGEAARADALLAVEQLRPKAPARKP